MRSKGKSWKERICALLLALAMVLTGIMPGSAATVEAAETTDVFFTIKDADNDDGVLNSDITVEVFKKGNTDDSEAIEAELVKGGPHRNTYRISSLEVNEEYVYTVEKTGYEYDESNDSEEERTFIPSTDTNEFDVKLRMSEIEVDFSEVVLYVRDEKTITITNPIANAEYNWKSNDSQIVTVDGGKLKAVGEGTTTVEVSYGSLPPTCINVDVKKIDIEEISLTVAPTAGEYIDTVTLKASMKVPDLEDLKEDDYRIPNKKMIFYLGENKIGEADIDITDGSLSAECEYSIKGQLGNLTFKAQYPGDDRYNERASEPVTAGAYKESKDLEFANGNNKTETRDDAENNFIIDIVPDSRGEREITFSSSDPNVAEVDEKTGEVTIGKAGKAIITVTAAANEKYLEDKKEYTVIVKHVVDINSRLNDPGWENYERVYDTTSEVELTLSLSEEEVAVGTSDVKVIFSADAKQKSEEIADVGTGYDAKITDESVEIIGIENGKKSDDLSEFYVVENYEGKTIEGKVTIAPRPVYIGTEDID